LDVNDRRQRLWSPAFSRLPRNACLKPLSHGISVRPRATGPSVGLLPSRDQTRS
jgi:hypothetical protein